MKQKNYFDSLIDNRKMDKIHLILIYEILGRPKDYIKTTLEQLIDRIGENPRIKIIERKVHEPHVVNEEKVSSSKNNVDEEKIKNIKIDEELFSTFAEVELEVDDLMMVFTLVLNTLPSSIEIIKPSELALKNFDLNSVLSELAIKLHKYDEITKALLLEKNQMINFIKEANEKVVKLGGKPIIRFESEKNEEDKSKEINASEKGSKKSEKKAEKKK